MTGTQLVFMDTEFTSFASPELVSIGMAASTGEEFYAEVPFPVAAASDFVREVVMPLLDGCPEVCCPADRLAVRILEWFAVVRTGADVVLCFDSPYDERLFRQIFDGFPPASVHFRNVGRNINELLRHDFHRSSGLPEHHALNDARAMRHAFRERVRSSRPYL